MPRPRTLLPLLVVLALLAGLAAACGGGGSDTESASTLSADQVPPDAVAIVAGTSIPRAEFDRFFSQAEAAAKARGEEFPKAGTPEYVDLQNQAIELLVRRIEFAKEAEALGIEVTEAEVDERLDELKSQFFDGDQAAYEKELEARGLTDGDVRADLRAQLLNEKIYEHVTKDVNVTDAEVRAFYDENKDEFATPDQRQVAHILVDTKKKADELYQQLLDGADFAELAKEHSTDEASAEEGGKLVDEKGSFVPEFEEVAFSLETGEISKPVKSDFGWHIITALEDTVPGGQTPFEEVKDQIRQQLLEQKRSEAMAEWTDQVANKYAPQIAYALGFGPPAAAQASNGG